MRKILLALFCFVLSIAVHGEYQNKTVRSYIIKYESLCKSLSKEYGIPASVIMAVAVVESGGGTTKLAKLLNNHFGIAGKNNLMARKPPIKSRYKQFDTVEDSFEEFCGLVSRRKFYPKLKGNNDYKKWISEISKTGYSTKPDLWNSKIVKVVTGYKLYELDK